MRANRLVPFTCAAALAVVAGALACLQTDRVESPSTTNRTPAATADRDVDFDGHDRHGGEATTLYVWASDQARVAPDFLAVIDFDRHSRDYGKVLRTVPIPPPGNVGNEAHHCHTSVDGNILACGGLLSVLKAQNDIFFFDISNARNPKFLFSTRAPNSSITDDFLPLPEGGFLVTNMGSASGGAGGRVVEFDKRLRLVAEYPATSPADGGFNPHGIDADFSKNLLVTSDFINPVTTLNVFAGDVELRSSLRFWNLRDRRITRTVFLPDNAGTMDVKLIPGDPHGRAVTANMFTGLVYSVDPTDGSYVMAFDCETIVPHVEVPVRGGMTQLLAMPRSGRRLIFGLVPGGSGRDARHHQPETVQAGVDRELRAGRRAALGSSHARRQASGGDGLFPQRGRLREDPLRGRPQGARPQRERRRADGGSAIPSRGLQYRLSARDRRGRTGLA